MQVIADLHGGNPHDPVAVAEYEEIKDKVREDVSSLRLVFETQTSHKQGSISVSPVKPGRMP